MTDTNDGAGQRDRSPAYPNIPLKSAVERLVEFDAYFKRSPARPEKIGDAWGIKGKAYVDRTAAALRYFGLLDYQGAGKDRQIVAAEDGRKYLRAQQEETKREVIKIAALRPKQIAKFWEHWGQDRPADPACIEELTFNHGFSDKGARDFLRIYDDTIRFAGLADSDKIPSVILEREPEEDPMTPQIPPKPANLPTPLPPKAGMLQEVFTLPEGPVTVTFPDSLSEPSYEDLKDYFELFLRKAKRRSAQRIMERADRSIPKALGGSGETER
jgi:hypothetical protein